MNKEFIRAPLCAMYNFVADGIRLVFGAGPERLMYRSLARRLVAEKDLFSISLTSGMQEPIFDAVRYLTKIEDRESISAISQLFDWCLYDRTSDLGENLEVEAVCALLTLSWHTGAQHFILVNFARNKIHRLSDRTVRHLLAHAIRTNMDIDPVLLERVFALVVESQNASKEMLRTSACG